MAEFVRSQKGKRKLCLSEFMFVIQDNKTLCYNA